MIFLDILVIGFTKLHSHFSILLEKSRFYFLVKLFRCQVLILGKLGKFHSITICVMFVRLFEGVLADKLNWIRHQKFIYGMNRNDMNRSTARRTAGCGGGGAGRRMNRLSLREKMNQYSPINYLLLCFHFWRRFHSVIVLMLQEPHMLTWNGIHRWS